MNLQKNNTLKAELWDKVQYMFRNFYDRMMHVALYYDGKIDLDNLKAAISYILVKIPVFRSTFVPRDIIPYWKVNKEYNIDEYVSVVETNDKENAINEFLTSEISPFDVLQLKIRIVREKGMDTLLFLGNHMCCDGGDLKYIIGKIVECYNACVRLGTPENVEIKTGTRSFNQLYSGMKGKDKFIAHELWSNASAVKSPAFFPFTEDGTEEKRYILKNKVLAPDFCMLKKIGKERKATVNDMLICAYIRALSSMVGTEKPINVISMIDLRRYIPGGQTKGLTNMTGFMPITVSVKADESFFDTLKKVQEETLKAKQDKFLGLHGTPLLRRAFHLFPIFSLAQTIIKLGYNNPPIGMSNIGVLSQELFSIEGLKLVDAFFTGALKFKPYMQLAMTTFEDDLTMSVAIRCNETDKENFEFLFENIHNEIKSIIE